MDREDEEERDLDHPRIEKRKNGKIRGKIYEPLDLFMYRWHFVIERLGRLGK